MIDRTRFFSQDSTEILLVSSLEKVMPEKCPTQLEDKCLHLTTGECGHFQLAIRNLSYKCVSYHISFSLLLPENENDLRCHISCCEVSNVPCTKMFMETPDEDYLFLEPGYYPDRLIPVPSCMMNNSSGFVLTAGDTWRSYWFEVEFSFGSQVPGMKQLPAQLRISINELCKESVQEDNGSEKILVCNNSCQEAALVLPISLLSKTLPELCIYHTEWFHGDCIADYYQVPVFSEEHWKYIENFMRSAVRHQINMILTPIFTPPLDTAIGGERTTIQLVQIKEQSGKDKKYLFDYSLLDQWITLAQKCGIKYFEISHLFTQWGAKYAPKVIVTDENGKEYREFGWDTPGTGEEYLQFLQEFLPDLKSRLTELGVLEKTWFHISDEPGKDDFASYSDAVNAISPLLEGCNLVDSISDIDFYKKGLVKTPIASINHIAPFLAEHVTPLWTYYCCAQEKDVPNRFIAMRSYRNRITGVVLYVLGVQGFIQWGFNFYNTQHSIEHIDPHKVTDAGNAFPSGDPFLVYPEEDGRVGESIRGNVLIEGMNDYRLLQMTEELSSREKVLEIIESAAGFKISNNRYPKTERFFEKLREQIWTVIASHE